MPVLNSLNLLRHREIENLQYRSYEPFKLVEDLSIPPAFSNLLFHCLQRIGNGKSALIGSIGSQRVINVYDLEGPLP